MNKTLKQHYQSVVSRGLITTTTRINDFIKKFHEESTEMLNEKIAFDFKEKNNFKHEVIDTIATLTNMLIHLGYDVEELFKENINHQNNRND